MAEIINLRRARKRRERDGAAQDAAEKRARFGRTRAERDAQAREADEASRALDGARLDGPVQPAGGNPAENRANDRDTTS